MASRVEEEAPALATDEDQISEKSWQKSDREFLMVMVTFIATVSFQAGTNPPGGVWQDDNNPRYEAGKSIMASKQPSRFLAFITGVTTTMVVSVMQLLVLMNELPFKKSSVSRNFLYFTLGIAFTFMTIAYCSSIIALTPQSQLPQIIITLLINLVTGVVGLLILFYIQSRDVFVKYIRMTYNRCFSR
ncbi:unnamed protein product [Citrullus colocynthis]|uniref:PGG domain-containing protein n=1 Tax=Citrullus colocynthis TaxID=252529 RepID=A0ABP0Y0E7_9ROSI